MPCNCIFLKTILSILLALNLFVAGIFPAAEAEWAKLSQLVTHFEDHQKEAGAEISFVDFLLLHYYSEHGKCGHSDLPHCCHSGIAHAFIITYPESISIDFFIAETGFYNENYGFNYCFNLIHSLLQPPQSSIFQC